MRSYKEIEKNVGRNKKKERGWTEKEVQEMRD
jgi:hypothetical protein